VNRCSSDSVVGIHGVRKRETLVWHSGYGEVKREANPGYTALICAELPRLGLLCGRGTMVGICDVL